MSAPKGNQFWKLAPTIGRKPIWENPEDLKAACEEYFEYVDNHPLWESKAFSYEGSAFDHPIDKMRAMTLDGLCVFLGISRKTWHNYQNKEEFLQVVEYVEMVMREQKLTGAAAGLLNANIIARDLQLRDASDVNIKATVSYKEMSDDDLDREIEDLSAKP
jgi:hypothetical protein